LALYNNFATKEYLEDSAIEMLKVLPPAVSMAWSEAMKMSGSEIDPSTIAYAEWMRETVGYLNQKEVPFMAGTDTPIGFLIPGVSLHRELELLVQSGLSNLEAIEAATIEPARFLGVERHTSRILEGYEADLILLRGNPLENISATKEIEKVIKSGKVVPIEEF
jgi:imidazolonepropionase-like amidohydrolase